MRQAGRVGCGAAFDKASSAWAAARVYSFGAAELFNRAYRVEFWPDERNRVSKQLRQTIAEADPKILEPKGFDRASVAIQGLPALERILFADDAPDGYACALGGAIALNIATIANELNDAWADPDKAFFTLETGEARAQRLVTASVATLAGLRDRKLARPMREDAASARPKMLNKWRSGRAGRDVSADLMALERLYDAAFRPEIGASPIDGLLRDAREKAAALEDTLFTAVADADTRPQADALLAAVKALEDVYAETLAKQLGLVVGFNSLDGD